MLAVIKFIVFISILVSFGFIALNKLTKIKSLILLIPLSIACGISTYIFVCHSLSFLIGTQSASTASLASLLVISLILFLKDKSPLKFESELSKKQLTTVCLISSAITFLSFLALSRFGIFDKGSHFPIALTIFHNNVYPPRDIYRPDYILLYHYGGDLFAGAIHHISNLNISRSFELISTICSGTIFLGLFSLAWLLTKNFKVSLIAAFCSYFSGGLLWLDAIYRYLWKVFPPGVINWNFLQTLFNFGLHGGITEAPSVHSFLSTFGLGYILLIFSIILFWKMLEEKNLISQIPFIVFLSLSLFSLSLVADWLFVTFWGAVLLFLLTCLFIKRIKDVFIPIVILAIISVISNYSIGNPLFLQDELQHIGRAATLDIQLKEKPFWILSWRILNENINGYQPIFAFSWDFISEFGFSLFLIPIALIYLKRTKNLLGFILLSCTITTFPIPLFLDFKLNPVELNRFFSFGNTMLVLLISCGIGTIYKSFFERKSLVLIYLLIFCTSPFLGLVSASIFTPRVYTEQPFVEIIFESFKQSNFSQLNKYITKLNNAQFNEYKDILKFLRKNSKPNDVAISNLYELPGLAGVYTIIPPKRSFYWELLYSSQPNIYKTILATLDPHLLSEINIKWIIITKDFKNKMNTEAKEILNDPSICNLVHEGLNKEKNEWVEIYHVKNLKNNLENYTRKTAWLLQDKNANPAGITLDGVKKISLFSSSKEALLQLIQMHKIQPALKKELITAQAVPIKALEKQLEKSRNNIIIEKVF